MGTALLYGNNGSSDLSFTVKTYVSVSELLADASRNHNIGVVTEIKPQRWGFSPAAPEEPVEGEIWFSVSEDSAVSFNVLKKNRLPVFPRMCRQYLSGAWVHKAAYLAQNGSWVQICTDRVPAGYTQVEYVQCGQDQYIDTEIVPTVSHGFEIDYTQNNSSGAYCVMGCRTASGEKEFQISAYNGGIFRVGLKEFTCPLKNGTRVFVEKHGATMIDTNGDAHDVTATGNLSGLSIKLFAMDTKGTIGQYSRVMLYALRLYDENDVLAADFVPVIRQSDSVVGLWDAVRERFFTSNTKTLIAGGTV